MSDHVERIAKARRNVQEWAEKADAQVSVVQAEHRKRDRGEPHDSGNAEQLLRAMRARLSRHREILAALREEWSAMEGVDRSVELWRDAAQDAAREVTRTGKTLRRLRRESKAEAAAAAAELALHPDGQDPGATAETGDLQLVFTNKRLTEAEEAHQEAVRDLHRAQRFLSKARKKKADAASGPGTREAVIWAALESADKQRDRYSQAGQWSLDKWPSEPDGYRTDCSQWYTKQLRHAGVKVDPNGGGWDDGYTGTMLAYGKAVSRNAALPADAVVFGAGDGHHTEMMVFPHEILSAKLNAELKRRGFGRWSTIGHGSPPVDMGSVDMMSDMKRFRSFAFEGA